MLRVIYNPYINKVNYQYKNIEDSAWKNVDEFSDFCNKAYSGWDKVKDAINANYEKYCGPRTEENKDVFFIGTRKNMDELINKLPDYSIQSNDDEMLFDEDEFKDKFVKLVKKEDEINESIEDFAKDVIGDKFILFDNPDTGLNISKDFRESKDHWIQYFKLEKDPVLDDWGNAKINQYKEMIVELDSFYNEIIAEHERILLDVESSKRLKLILSAVDKAIDIEKIYTDIKNRINKHNWSPNTNIECLDREICEVIDRRVEKLSSGMLLNIKSKIRKTVTKELRGHNSDAIDKLNEYIKKYKVFDYSKYCNLTEIKLDYDMIDSNKVIVKLINSPKTWGLDEKEKAIVEENYSGVEDFVKEMVATVKEYHISQMRDYLEDTIGFIRTNVLLYFEEDKYKSLRDCENRMAVCNLALDLFKRQLLDLENLRNMPLPADDKTSDSLDSDIKTQEEISEESLQVIAHNGDEITNDSDSNGFTESNKKLNAVAIRQIIKDKLRCNAMFEGSSIIKGYKYWLYTVDIDKIGLPVWTNGQLEFRPDFNGHILVKHRAAFEGDEKQKESVSEKQADNRAEKRPETRTGKIMKKNMEQTKVKTDKKILDVLKAINERLKPKGEVF
jgi:hypothetical protein